MILETLFKIFLTYISGGPFVQGSKTICAFFRGHFKEHFCKTILDLCLSFRKYHLKIFLSTAMVVLFRPSGTICEILVEDIMRNIYVNLL